MLIYLYWRKHRWIRVGEVDQLFLFPLKGGRLVSVSELECGVLGPRSDHLLDRGFMIGKKNVGFLKIFQHLNYYLQGEAIDTRGAFRKVILISLSSVGDGWWKLEAPGHQSCVFRSPYSHHDTSQFKMISLKLWDVVTHGLDCGDDVSRSMII